MKIYLLFISFLLLAFFSCGRQTGLVVPSDKKDVNWLESYQVFYRDPLIVIRGLAKEGHRENIALSKIKIQISLDGKNFKEFKSKKISKRVVDGGFEFIYLPFAIEEAFFQAVFVNENTYYYSDWKKPYREEIAPKPSASSLRISFQLDGTSILTAYFTNRKNYRVAVYGDKSVFPIYENKQDNLNFRILDKLKWLHLRYLDEYGNESTVLDVSNKLFQ